MLGSYPCVFVNLTKARGSWEEGLSVEEMPPPNWTAEKPAGIFLTSDRARGERQGISWDLLGKVMDTEKQSAIQEGHKLLTGIAII